MPAYDFSGRTVVVTGSFRGIGHGVAEGFAKAGADLVLIDMEAGVKEVAAAMAAAHGVSVTGHVADITDPAALDAVFATVDHIDVLVNNAGLELVTPVESPDPAVEDTFRRIVDINVMGTFYVTRRALPKMGRGGRIVITSSMWGKTAVAEMSAYCATKHANIGFMRSLAMELGPRGIAVNAVCPGWVKTVASMRSLKAMAESSGRSEDALLAEIMAAQAFDGLMEPPDMTDMYLFLASDAARNITGQAVTVDRGELLA
ncbi:MAG: 3-beta hydroxysteroid dehydrogenase [Rhodospirillaceae bacterium]|nr:3-beta hydroxysteroid dehydrogenase [Rhodospirillaceae bacterium]